MTFGNDVDAALPRLREAASDIMSDTCIVKVPSGRNTINPLTLVEEQEYGVAFITKCRVKLQRDAESAVLVPWDCPPVDKRAVIEITGIGPRTPANILGKKFSIAKVGQKSTSSSTRIAVLELDPRIPG